MKLHSSASALLLLCIVVTVSAFSTPQSTTALRIKKSYFPEESELSTSTSDDESSSSSKPLTQAQGDLPPVIQQIADERQEFNVNLGKAMDTLRKDMPEILRSSPDYSIYHDKITMIDPSGVRINGLENYRSAIRFFQTFLKFWCSSSSRLQTRQVYDFARSTIRVSWNIVLIPKLPLGSPMFVDGISHYKLDPSSGKIIEHKIENLTMNDTPVIPPYGIFSMLQQSELLGQRKRVPVGVGMGL